MRPRSPQRSGASDTDQHLLSRDIAQGRRGLEEFGTTIVSAQHSPEKTDHVVHYEETHRTALISRARNRGDRFGSRFAASRRLSQVVTTVSDRRPTYCARIAAPASAADK
jgi:hypothetical protein